MTVVTASAVLAHAFATFQANAKAARERDYSSPAKFVEPKYADIADMEAVSFVEYSCSFTSTSCSANCSTGPLLLSSEGLDFHLLRSFLLSL